RPSVLGDAAVRGVGGILESAPQIPGMWQKIVDDYHRELLVAARQTQTHLENIHPSRTIEQQLTIMLRDRHTRPIAQLAHKYGAQAPGRVRAMVKQFLFQPPNTLTCPVTSITVTLLPNRG